MSDEEETETLQWMVEEAFNFEKMLSGERRLDFMEWKAQRDQKARTVRGGQA